PENFGKRQCICRFKHCRRALDFPSWVIKGGEVVVKDGVVLNEVPSVVFRVAPSHGESIRDKIREEFEKYYTISFDNYPVQEDYLKNTKEVICG
ncbi:MAG: formylmethanofuran dehydrogenase subunit A, partial [Acetomicrobium sp.]